MVQLVKPKAKTEPKQLNIDNPLDSLTWLRAIAQKTQGTAEYHVAIMAASHTIGAALDELRKLKNPPEENPSDDDDDEAEDGTPGD